MTKEKIKSLSLSKLKIAEAEKGKERRVTFVASSSQEDRDYETLDIGSFRLPKKGGGYITVRDLPSDGSENVDIPFLTNHDLYAVEKTIGSVRRAMFVEGELIFEAGISGRDYAQDVFKLIEEGHLDNAFSIQFRDYDWNPEAKTISNGEIIEVSLVTRGSNKEAQVLEVKQVKGEEMPTPTNEPAKDEGVKTDIPEAETKTTDVEANADAPAEPETKSVQEDKEDIMNDLPDHNAKMAAMVQKPGSATKLPSQAATSGDYENEYLKSKAAVLDYAKLAKKCNGDAVTTNEAWKEHLAAKGVTITGEDGFLPTRVEQVMFKAWHDAVGALRTFRRTSAKAFKFYAMTTESTALGHKRGEKKADQDIVAIPRNGGLKVLYKKLPLDWIDIVNDESGELYVFRTRELTDRLLHAIVKNAILGDGLSAPATGQPDYRAFDGVNGLYPMVGDLNNSSTTGSYASIVATVVANVSTDDNYAKIVKTLEEVNLEDGERAVLVIPKGYLAELRLAKNENGGYLYSMSTDFRELFGVAEIVEFSKAEMAAVGYDVIAYKDQGYTLGGPDMTVRNWFDGNVNQDVMLVEQPVTGSLEGNKVVAGYAASKA